MQLEWILLSDETTCPGNPVDDREVRSKNMAYQFSQLLLVEKPISKGVVWIRVVVLYGQQRRVINGRQLTGSGKIECVF